MVRLYQGQMLQYQVVSWHQEHITIRQERLKSQVEIVIINIVLNRANNVIDIQILILYQLLEKMKEVKYITSFIFYWLDCIKMGYCLVLRTCAYPRSCSNKFSHTRIHHLATTSH